MYIPNSSLKRFVFLYFGVPNKRVGRDVLDIKKVNLKVG